MELPYNASHPPVRAKATPNQYGQALLDRNLSILIIVDGFDVYLKTGDTLLGGDVSCSWKDGVSWQT